MSSENDKWSIPRKIVKAIAMLGGLFFSLICLMAIIGALTANGWARSLGALVVLVVVPAIIADRAIPDDDEKAKGVPTDVFSLVWLGFPLVFGVVLGSLTNKMLVTEGDRLARAGMGTMAKAAYLMAGVDAKSGSPGAGPVASSSATASASATASGSASKPAASTTASASTKSKPPPPSGDELSDAELFKKYAPAVVSIKIKRGGSFIGGGTGFLIDTKGRIATNFHVIESAKGGAEIGFKNGARYDEIWVLEADSAADLALLQVDLTDPKEGDPPDVEPVTLGDSGDVVVGERAISIGNPLGLEHTLTTGVVSSRRTYKGRKWIQMSTPISPGNSGGPVFTGKGLVMGVTTAQIRGGMFGGGAQNLNLAVPINELKSKLKPDYPNRRKLGSGGPSSSW